jgi:metal-responsive CopG/Arc/MetJ family transcriptional regulator
MKENVQQVNIHLDKTILEELTVLARENYSTRNGLIKAVLINFIKENKENKNKKGQ